ncbi:MAG: hypothetical protein DMG13_11435 [Acidobacteria bacterium]|nr:MAG: hypothetical protein DMG13_11435 [Acidobacteriota bacterium]
MLPAVLGSSPELNLLTPCGAGRVKPQRGPKGGAILPHRPNLTTDEQKLNDVWNEHVRAEFDAHSADQTVATMVANPLINQVPVMIGGDGKEEVYESYAKYCLSQIPPDFEIVPVSRTIGQGRLVDEIVLRFNGREVASGKLTKTMRR